jgi:hypothetical protein
MILENSKLYYGNSALLNKLKYYPVPYCLLSYFCLGLLFLQHKNSDPNFGLNGKRNSASNRHATFFLNRMGRNLEIENVDESTTIEIEKILSDYKPLQTVSQNWLRTHIRKKRYCRRDPAIL